MSALGLVAGAAGVGVLVWAGWAAHQLDTAAPAVAVPAVEGVPARAVTAYVAAAAAAPCPISWPQIAATMSVESHHGTIGGRAIGPDGRLDRPLLGVRLDGSLAGTAVIIDSDGGRFDGDPAYDRALGPAQALPSTWLAHMGPGDDPHDLDDAARFVAVKVCADSGGRPDDPAAWAEALYAYNRSRAYVADVVAEAGRLASSATGAAVLSPADPGGPTVDAIGATMADSGRRRWEAAGARLSSGDTPLLARAYGMLDPLAEAALDRLAGPGPGAAASSRPAPAGGRYQLPVDGIPAEELDDPHHDYPAWDLALDEGTPLLAVTAGTVVPVDNGRCGIGVAISGDDGLRYVYCHLATRSVNGGRVAAGQQVGTSGNTGNSTGPHLHFAILTRDGSAALCPQPALQAWAAGRTNEPPPRVTEGCVY